MAAAAGGPERTRRRRRYVHLAAAFALNSALLAALGLGLADTAPPPGPAPVPPAVYIDLIPARPERPPPPAAHPAPDRAAPAPRPTLSSPTPSPLARAPAAAGPPGPPSAGRPIGARAGSEPVGPTGPIGTQAAIRASTGCESPEYLRLNPSEAERCEARNRRLWAANPKSYAVISQEKKDFFDGACKRDDDWCLYRTGQGPYPGLLALGKKKKRSD